LVKNSQCFNNDCPQKYDRIIAINEQPIGDLIEELFQYIPSDGNNTTFKLEAIKRDFNELLFLHKGSKEKYIITFVNQEKDTITTEINTISPPRKRPKNEFEFDFQKDLTQYLPDQDIAILTPPMPLPRD